MSSFVLALALLAAPQTPNDAPSGSLGQATRRVPPPPQYPFSTYTNGGRIVQLGLLHGEGLETFGLFRPGPLPPGTPAERPLLVLFHSFGGDGDLELEHYTAFPEEADARHWYVLAPDQDIPLLGTAPTGGSLRRKTYGGEAAQWRVEFALRWVLERYPIDRSRIYGVGFSMGGGDVLSYAAQHLDPSAGAFAAVAVNAGTLALTEEYWRNTNHPDAGEALRRSIGGGIGPNTLNRFDFERASSLLYVNPYATSVLDLGRRQPAQNLAATPVQAWLDPREPSAHLTRFVDDLELVLGPSQSGGLFERHDVVGTGSFGHAWETFDWPSVCDTLAAHRLDAPDHGHFVAGRDARYGEVWLEREDRRAFGELRYDLRAVGGIGVDRVTLDACLNIRRARFDGGVLGLGLTGGAYELEVEGNPTRGWTLQVDNVLAPSAVLRNGIDVTAAQNTLWAHDTAAHRLSVLVAPGVVDVWTIL